MKRSLSLVLLGTLLLPAAPIDPARVEAAPEPPAESSPTAKESPEFRLLRPPLLGFALQSNVSGDTYRTVEIVAEGDSKVLATGSLEECEERLLAALRTKYGTGRSNIPFVTLGGKQLWGDVFIFQGWRIQEHVYSGHHRLVDPNEIRRAWGAYEGCRVAFEERRVESSLRRSSDHLVLLVHGLGRSRHSFSVMRQALSRNGYEVDAVGYPSTRRSLNEHAEQLQRVLERAAGVKSVSFVTHSLGGIVVRKLLSMDGAWRDAITPKRVVMLAPPSQGSVVANVLQEWMPFQMTVGDVGQDLTTEALLDLPAPPCSFGIIAGGTGTAEGFNPVLAGDNDGVVLVKNAQLPGSDDFLLLRSSHTMIMRKSETIAATLSFLESGRFVDREPSKSPAPDSRQESAERTSEGQ